MLVPVTPAGKKVEVVQGETVRFKTGFRKKIVTERLATEKRTFKRG